jgi:hypothetical protein
MVDASTDTLRRPPSLELKSDRSNATVEARHRKCKISRTTSDDNCRDPV